MDPQPEPLLLLRGGELSPGRQAWLTILIVNLVWLSVGSDRVCPLLLPPLLSQEARSAAAFAFPQEPWRDELWPRMCANYGADAPRGLDVSREVERGRDRLRGRGSERQPSR